MEDGSARRGLAWLDLRLAALPDTLFKFLLVSNQPQPGSQPSQPEQRPCTPLGMPPILRAATSCSLWLCRQTADCFQFVAQSAVQSICQRHHECQGLVPTHSRFWGWAPATVPAASPPSLYRIRRCLWALERLSQGLFLHNLGLLIPQSSFKWRRAAEKAEKN